MTRRLLPGVLVALAVAAPAQAATKTLSVARSADRDCTARVLSSAKSGVARTTFTAPAEGTVRAQLTGSRRAGDWDLGAFDSKGRLIAGSKGFNANELVEVHLRPGARITLQACRLSGKGRSAKLRTTFSAFDFESLQQSGPVQLVEVPISGPLVLRMLENLGLDVTHDIHDGHARLMLYGDKDRDLLTRTGLGFEVVQADVEAATRAFREQDRQAAAAGPSPLPTGRTTYRTFEEIQQELKDMISKYPELVRGFNLPGKTFQGRDIPAVEIASNVASEDDGRPVLYLNGIHHAREWPATEVIMEFAWDLLKNHGSDPQLAGILKNVRVVLQPWTNVDGFIVSRGGPNRIDPDSLPGDLYSTATGVVLLGGSLEYKRKNCNPYPLVDPSPVCEHKIGTDNNRNYPHTWGGRGSSTNPNDQSYRGKAPASEPETNAVQLQQLSMNAPVLISMHNIAAKVLRPPGTEAEGLAPDEAGLKELGRRMAEPTGYLNQYGHELYDVTGGTKDWAYAVTGAAGYTVETGPANGDFHGAYKSVVIDQYMGKGDKLGRGMREALIAAAQWTRNEEWTGRITGRAPAGRTLRITKSIITLSDPVCTVADVNVLDSLVDTPDECIQPGDVIETPEKVDIVTKVPKSGRFTWWVNPSSRPYAKGKEAYKLTCEQDGKVLQEMDVVVGRGETFKADLPCGGTLPADDGSDGSGSGSGSGGGSGSNGGSGGGSGGAGNGGGSTGPAGRTATLKIGAVKRAGRKLRLTLSARGGKVSALKITVRKGRRTVARGKLRSLSGSRKVVVKAKRRVARGKYTVRVSGKGAATVTRKLRIK
jgi:uncharacterized membrane protein YgcG